MDTNNNSRLEMDIQQEQADQLPQTEQEPQGEQETTNKHVSHENNEDQNPDRIELYVKYEASDMLRDESGTQTPIEDEPSQGGGGDSSSTTNAICNNNQEQQQESSASNNSTSEDQSKSNKTMVIRVQESEDENAESIEIELEDDNSLLLTSLTSLFPDATGLVFRHPVTNQRRAVKFADGKFAEPIEGWSFAKNYICVFNRGAKRKTDDDNDASKKAKTDTDRPGLDGGSDLVVLGLPWTTTEDTMRSYFEQYGEVVMVQVKTEKSGKSRGFGFVRFAKSSIQNKLLSMRHFIDGRWCDVRVPLSKAEADATKAAQLSRKIFVGRLPDNITPDDLRNHFSEYGTLTDVFIPKPFRNFAFVTFGTSDMAQSIFKHKHVIKGSQVQISEAIPKDNAPNNYGGGGYNSGPQPNAGSYGGGAGFIGNANNNIHPFNNNYGAHQVPYHHHGKNSVTGNFGGSVYPNNRKMHQQSTYYQMPSFGSSGPSSSVDSTNYANHSAHSDYGAFGGATSGYNQPQGGVNGGQYYKMQQQQPVMTSNQNHSTYPNQSSYSNHGANFSRSSYGSVWK
jgi:RNA recognition motif-containing protein